MSSLGKHNGDASGFAVGTGEGDAVADATAVAEGVGIAVGAANTRTTGASNANEFVRPSVSVNAPVAPALVAWSPTSSGRTRSVQGTS